MAHSHICTLNYLCPVPTINLCVAFQKHFFFFPFIYSLLWLFCLLSSGRLLKHFFFNNLILTVRIAYVIDRLYTLGIERLLIKFGWKMTDFKPILNVFDKTHCFYANSKMIKRHFHLYRAFTLRGDPKE